MWRRALVLIAWLALLAPLPVRGAEGTERPIPVVDLAVHLPYQAIVEKKPLSLGSGQADAVRMRRGGVIGAVLPLLGHESSDALPSLESSYLGVYRALADSGELRIPGCRRPAPGIRTWLAIEGAEELAGSPSSIGLWVTRGVRIFGLTRDHDNSLATGAASRPPVVTGLSDAGRVLVHAIDRAGGLVDLSHASALTRSDVIAIARADGVPVVATHSNARALADDDRNLDDAEIRAVAASGGVIGVNFGTHRLVRGKEADLADVVKQIRYLLRVAGVDHVAIGSGYEGGIHPPHELLNASRFPRLAAALREAGLSRDTVSRVFHRNALRLLCPPGNKH